MKKCYNFRLALATPRTASCIPATSTPSMLLLAPIHKMFAGAVLR